MYKYPIDINGKKFSIQPYNTEKEKDILIMSSFEIYDIDEILRVLGLGDEIINKLTHKEKKVVLFKFREISVGEELNIKFKCTNCQQQQDGFFSISGIITKSGDLTYKQLDKEVTDENLHEFVDISEEEILNLELNEYENLLQKVKDSQVNYNFTRICKCIKCKQENYFSIYDDKYIIESLSEDTLMSLYKTYNDMCMFGKYSKRDVDSLYPFERTILIGLINKTREEIKQGVGK